MLKKLFQGLQVTIQSHCTECGFMLPTGVLVEISAEQCAAVASHHAEQECIGFAEWKDKNYIEPHKGIGYVTFQQYHTIENLSIVPKHTLKELYQLYLKSKQL